ncbi:4-carboxymuconolactone decarboxylase [Alicyclobacillus sacchari]|uniref:4-carboxymuconolactone decarboxylase n=1 Tax=Alicyclobacillus sacchari TaxID=392010 RepID=A0A4R8L5A7_9BACL|nr:4-carboxymuconolactone decarboxylase [Alicyclobacillus sacchari]
MHTRFRISRSRSLLFPGTVPDLLWGERTIASFQDIAPDLGKYIIEFAYGDIYSRPGLDLKQRQLLTITCLTTQGDCEPELSVHINTGLNVGLTQTEIIEAILHCIPYVGFPRVMNAMTIAKKVFSER